MHAPIERLTVEPVGGFRVDETPRPAARADLRLPDRLLRIAWAVLHDVARPVLVDLYVRLGGAPRPVQLSAGGPVGVLFADLGPGDHTLLVVLSSEEPARAQRIDLEIFDEGPSYLPGERRAALDRVDRLLAGAVELYPAEREYFKRWREELSRQVLAGRG